MRPSLIAALAVVALAANANAQDAQIVPLSFESAARAGISSPASNPSSVRAVESDTGSARHGSVARGAAIGFAVGFVVGASAAALSIHGFSKEEKQLKWVAAAVNGLIGGVIGGVAGAVIAYRHHSQSMPLTPAASR